MIFGLLRFLSAFVRRVPTAWANAFGKAIGRFWFSILRFRRGVVLDNLRLAYGNSKSEAQLQAIASQNFRHYGQLLVEVVRTVGWQTADYRREVTIHGIEHLHRFTEAGVGGYILTGHFGNWEIAIGATAAAGIPIDVVVKRSPSAGVEAFLREYRRKTGAEILIETGTARDILKSVNRGRFVAFVLDQFMGPPIGLPVTFFGHPAGTAVSLALLTEKRTEPVIPSYSFRDEHDRLHTVFGPPIVGASGTDGAPADETKEDRLYRKTQLYNDVLEGFVRRAPEQWLWLHKRWKAYRGSPRWAPKVSLSTVTVSVALLLTAGCETMRSVTPTGIAVPPDKKVSIPRYTAQAEQEESGEEKTPATAVPAATPPPPAANPEVGAAPTPTAAPAPEPTRAPTPVGESKPEKKKTPKAPEKKATPSAAAYKVIDAERIPFEIGEKMEIDLNWMAIPAGRTTIEVDEGPKFDDRPTFLLFGNVVSSKVVDAIYHVDNSIESFVDRAGLMPYKFLLHMVETAQKKETRVSFDQVQHKAHYWAQRISQKWGDELADRSDDIQPRSQDMFSALYFARTLNYRLGVKRTIPVYANKQQLDVELLPVANEFIRTPAGYFQCWKLSLVVKINNILKPSGDIFLWLSDDSKRYIVKFDAKLKVGSLIGTLVSVRARK